MWKISVLCAAALSAAACARAAPVVLQSAAPVPGNASCVLQAKLSNGMLTLKGVVYGRPATEGSYTLTLTKSGRAGNSNISQGGEFAVPASGEIALDETQMNIQSGDVTHAKMAVRLAHAEFACEGSYPLHR